MEEETLRVRGHQSYVPPGMSRVTSLSTKTGFLLREEEDEDEDEEEEKEKDAASSSSQEEERKDKSTPMASVRKRRKSSWKQKVLEEQLRCLVGWKCLNAKDWGSVKEDGEGRTEVQAPAAAAAPVEGFARSRSVDHQMKGSFMLFPEGIPRS
mmetsp:Transcript_34553/g.77910  ORF Transcript_34553/g.77910 Transcript_34553/m.77910 type:complete len:153 (-) Transcript_34553:46-504(-)